MRGVNRSLAAYFLAATLVSGCASGPKPAAQGDEGLLALDHHARLELAYKAIEREEWTKAVRILGTVIDESPADMRLRLQRGYARQAVGELSAAADDFRAAAREPWELQEAARASLAAVERELSDPEAIDARRDELLNKGYDELRRGRPETAREFFRRALEADPGRTDIARQLAYMRIEEGDLKKAAKDFEGVRKLEPRDYVTALELGYVYDSLRNEAAAERQFSEAARSPDERVRASALSALRMIRSRDPRLFLDLFASPYYTSRFSNKVVMAEAQAGWKPLASRPFSLYVGGRYAKDTRSSAGQDAELYADNAVFVGPGIRVQPRGWNLTLIAEWNAVFNLTRGGEHSAASENETRVVLSDYRLWDFPLRTFADLGGSVGYYSRYRGDTIVYGQARAGVKLLDRGPSRLSLYAPVNAVVDTNRDYYNNLVEFGGGVEFQPAASVNLKFRAEYLRGSYMGIQGRDPNPYGPRYHDIRLTLIWSGRLARTREVPADGWQSPVDRSGRPAHRW